MEKKRFLSGIARMMGGGLPMPEFFGPLLTHFWRFGGYQKWHLGCPNHLVKVQYIGIFEEINSFC